MIDNGKRFFKKNGVSYFFKSITMDFFIEGMVHRTKVTSGNNGNKKEVLIVFENIINHFNVNLFQGKRGHDKTLNMQKPPFMNEFE